MKFWKIRRMLRTPSTAQSRTTNSIPDLMCSFWSVLGKETFRKEELTWEWKTRWKFAASSIRWLPTSKWKRKIPNLNRSRKAFAVRMEAPFTTRMKTKKSPMVRSRESFSSFHEFLTKFSSPVPEASVGAGQRPMAQQASPVQQSEQSGQPVRVSSSHSYNLRPRLSFVSYTSITKRARQEDSASSAPPAAKKRKTSKNGKKRANKRKMPTKVTSAAKRQRRC